MATPLMDEEEAQPQSLRSKIAAHVAANRGDVKSDLATMAGVAKKDVNDTNVQAVQTAAESGDDGELTNKQKLIAQALLAFVPTALGAALGGAQGGAAGAAAGMQGVQGFQASEDKLKQEKTAQAEKKLAHVEKQQHLASEKQKADVAEKHAKAQESHQQKQIQLEYAKLGQTKSGKPMAAEQTDRLSGHEASLATLSDLRKTIQANPQYYGPVGGRLRALNPYSDFAKGIESLNKTAAQNIGKSLEGGKLTDQDILRYQKMLPSNADSPEVAQTKIDLLERMVNQKRNADLSTFAKAGLNVAEFAQSQIPESKILSPEQKGAARPERGTAMAGEATPEDQAAIQWAKSNPKDPRAKAILNLHGME